MALQDLSAFSDGSDSNYVRAPFLSRVRMIFPTFFGREIDLISMASRCIVVEMAKNLSCPVCRTAMLVRLNVAAAC